MFKTALARGEKLLSAKADRLLAAVSANEEELTEENGIWFYLVTDSAGIRLHVTPTYSKESKRATPRLSLGTVVEVDKRRRAGWTRWLSLASGEGWIFDISPKDRKVRMVEVEVQRGSWQYEVCMDAVPVLPSPQLGAKCNSPTSLSRYGSACLHMGDVVTALERVRPLVGRGVFLRLAEVEGWVLDFVAGSQTLRRRASCESCMVKCKCACASDDVVVDIGSSGPPRFACGPEAPGHSVGTAPLTCGSPSHGSQQYSPSKTSSNHSKVFDEAVGEPEYGKWSYIVLDPKGLSLRGRPTYDKAAKLPGGHVEHGEVLPVVERRAGGSGATTFLRTEGGDGGHAGWAFDTQPGANSFARLVEVKPQLGRWFYRVVGERGCPVRTRCSLVDSAKTGVLLDCGAVVRVNLRMRVGVTTFLKLTEGIGWIYDCGADSKQLVDGPLEIYPMRQVNATVNVQGEDDTSRSTPGLSGGLPLGAGSGTKPTTGGVRLLKSPTFSSWALTNMFVLHAAKVQVNLRTVIDGVQWMEIQRPGGMTGWVPADAVLLEPQLTSNPGWSR